LSDLSQLFSKSR